MFSNRRKKQLQADLPIERLQDITRVLFIDDEDRSDVIDYLHEERWHCRQIFDLDSVENAELKDAHIICIDIRGVGLKLSKEKQGLDIVLSVHSRYPEKKIILYSSSAIHDIFHKANDIVDKRIYKRSGDLEVFRSAIEELSRKCFVWNEVVSNAFKQIKSHLPPSMTEDEFSKVLTAAVTARRPWSIDKLTRVLAAGVKVAQVIQLVIQLFASKR